MIRDGNVPAIHVFDVFGGIRYAGLKTEVVFSQLNQSSDRTLSWVDPIFGGRWVGKVSPKITLLARGDIGGFGAGSELTFSLQGGLEWRFHRILGLAIAYRCLDYDYEKSELDDPDFFEFDNSMHGAALGLTFSW